MSMDDAVEGLGRRQAAHTTRRTMLGRFAKVGVPVAGSPALATLLTERAAAPIYGFVNNHRAAFNRAVLGGSFGTLGDQGVYDFQSTLHQFDTHRLQGRSGQGLPAVSPPRAERGIGRARLAGTTPQQEPAYWSSRAKVVRKG